MPHIDQPGGVLLAERLAAEAFPSGREARSDQYKPGDPRRDAFYAGIGEGKHIAQREQRASRESGLS